MFRSPIRYVHTVVALACLSFVHTISAANAPADDHAALTRLTETHAVFDITTGNPQKLKFYLNLIAETAESVQSQGVKPVFVLAFRGPATPYISTDRSALNPEQKQVSVQIGQVLDKLSKMNNVTLEQCGVAAKMLHVQPDTIHPGVKVVGNSWISLMGYQNRGYALIPVR